MNLDLGSVYPLYSIRKLESLVGRDRKDLSRIASHAGRYYKPFDQRPIGGSKWRHIDQSRGELKLIQKRIQKRILRVVTLPATMLGSSPGRSIKDNLDIHAGAPFVLSLDLRDCFPRTSPQRIFSVYRDVFGCSSEIASILTKLTTFQHRVPQGAPSSPTLVNLSLLPLHDDLQNLALGLGLNITFWVDDIAISGARAREAVEPAIRLIMKHGHAVRRRKIRMMPAGERQMIPGGIVNQTASAGRKLRIEPLREEILQLAASGVVPRYRLLSVWGSIQQITGLSPSQGASLKRLAKAYLPVEGIPALKPPKVETMPCFSARKHARH